jgi:hypothetical protein
MLKDTVIEAFVPQVRVCLCVMGGGRRRVRPLLGPSSSNRPDVSQLSRAMHPI